MRAIIFDIDQTLFDADETLRDGVADLLAVLHRLGIKMGAVTDLDHRAVVRLDEAGISQFFGVVRCSDQVTDPKDVATLRDVVEELGVALEHSAFVSHSHHDIRIGKRAGLAKAIGVSHGSDRVSVLRRAGADHVVENIPTVLDVLH